MSKDHLSFVGLSAEDLNNFFVSLGPETVKNIVPKNDFKKYLKNRVSSSFFINPVTADEIINVVKHLPAKASTDCDGLSIKLIKHIINFIVEPLCVLINKSFNKGVFPNSLKIAKIVPIYKSGDKKDIRNYRPVSLLPVFSKIFEKLMLSRLLCFFNKHNILHDNQHGSKAKYSTALADVLNYVTTMWDKKLLTIALFIDVSKAFDSLDHYILLSKLEHYGIRGVAYDWFMSYLSNRFQFTELNGSRSLLRKIISGVP